MIEGSMANIRSKEFVDGAESAAGKKLLAGNAREALLQECKKCDLAVGAWSEICRAALGWRSAMAVTIPIKNGFSEARTRGNDGDVVFRMIHATIEIKNVVEA